MERFKYPKRNVRIQIERPFKDIKRSQNINFTSLVFTRILVCFCFFLVMVSFPLSLVYCIKMIRQYERAVVFRLGKLFKKVKGPGLFFILPCLDVYEKVDTRIISFNVNPQKIVTRDLVTITVDLVIFFRIFDPYLALNKIYNVHHGTNMVSATVLRKIFGSRSLKEIINQKDFIIGYIHRLFNIECKEWGTVIERVEIKEIKLPFEVQKSMAAEAVAIQETRALRTIAIGEKKASHFLKNAADSLKGNKISIQLRYLQALSQIGSENNSTFIFPIPINSMHSEEKNKSDDEGFGVCAYLLIGLSYLIVISTFPLSLCFCIKIVKEYERAVILRLGRILSGGAKGPGLFFILPCIDQIVSTDLRTVTFDVPPQEILTKDSVTITVDAVCYYKIYDPVVSVTNVENAQFSTRLLAATTLRNTLGTRTLQEILQDKDIISQNMQETLDSTTDSWGIKVERVEVKDVRLPVQMQRAMATEAESSREARAKVIAAEGEQKASIALKQAADTINQSPIALQLRYLQTLTAISAEKNSTIIFPIPMEMIKAFSKS